MGLAIHINGCVSATIHVVSNDSTDVNFNHCTTETDEQLYLLISEYDRTFLFSQVWEL